MSGSRHRFHGKRNVSKVRFALVGCGRIARKHTEIIAEKLDNAVLAAVCDLDEERARHYGEKYAVPWFTDLHQMMTELGDQVDVVNVLTHSGDHARTTLELTQYGKHIVVEKPMALRLDDADRMIQACSDAGIKLFVVKQNRYNLPVVKMREALDAGRFGRLVLGTIRVRWCRDQAYYDNDPWRGTWKDDGGVLTNQASHHIDLLEWMMGDVETVFAKTETMLVNIETEDTGVAVLKFCNGALGVIEATAATRPKDLEGSISILGEKGSVEIGGFAVNEMRVWNFTEPTADDASVIEQYHQNPPDVYGFGHIAYLQEVVNCIIDDRPPAVDGHEGRRSLELIYAIYESAESGAEVKLPVRPDLCRLGR